MRSLSILLLTASLSEYASAFTGGHRDIYHDHYGQDLRRRNIVYDGHIADTYDFVIVGGGTAGLAIASRLSEDSNTTVLVLEAGDTGDAAADTINTPVNAYYHGLPGSAYDWAYTTVTQPNAGNRSVYWPCGKLLGGSSAMNGMYHVRPSKLEVDAWSTLVNGTTKWNWDALFAGMKDSETFTPPTSDVQAIAKMEYNAASRGTNGPIHASYPGFEFSTLGSWTATLANAGVQVCQDAYGGDPFGAYIATNSINPANWTRSYARSGYIDPLPPRDNLAILPNATVTRLLFDNSNANNLTATGVEWAASADGPRQTIKVRKEVILSSGAMGSPRVLMHSGVGPADVLQAAGVDVQVNLPGVGQHLQDHLSSGLLFQTNTDTAASLYASNATGNTPIFLSYVNSAVAYVNSTSLLGADGAASLKQQVSDALSSSLSSLVPSSDDTVKAGYEAIYNTTLNTIFPSDVGQVEILLQLTSSGPNGMNVLAIQAGLQHPYSHGRIYITSSDPFVAPAIDPQYLSHAADIVILREGLKLARKLGATAPLSAAVVGEVQPGTSVQSDADWEAWIRGQASTEFHPSSSCAMLPRELGGVVDEDLKVYGLANVRVADASVYPISVSAHLQAPTYGLAEQAAKIIRATYNGVGWPSSSGNSSSGSNNGSNNGNGSSDQTDKNSASRLASSGALALAAGALLAALL
ncbi:GMC oxidoreductase [Polyporus arcularius HHB13444]|uniref:GMC oxidoreductase n=1 Tax=Polyporus arcularius HHB13444 TaxID=1314778 RepID=A0A5C3P6N8_9APHY|nr:GMC oxidoreductase [Polyporus arcularius HHB13444]